MFNKAPYCIEFTILLSFIIGILISGCKHATQDNELLIWVDPFIGTQGAGNMYPGATSVPDISIILIMFTALVIPIYQEPVLEI